MSEKVKTSRYEWFKSKKARAAAAVFAGALTLVGYANYSGEGNEFEVKGVVTDPGEQSLKVRIYEIDETHGQANGWFEIGNVHQIHDNCDCHGAWSGRKTYGTVYDGGMIIEPSEVLLGSCVDLVGKIRANQEGKYTSDRPVFDTAQIIPCEDQLR